MGRRSDHTREELYETALGAAWDLAEAEGISGLTARRIADRIGYSAGTLYNVFEDLDDLIIHLMVRILDTLYDECSAVSPKATPEATLRELARVYVKFSEAHPNLWGVLFEHRWSPGKDRPDRKRSICCSR